MSSALLYGLNYASNFYQNNFLLFYNICYHIYSQMLFWRKIMGANFNLSTVNS